MDTHQPNKSICTQSSQKKFDVVVIGEINADLILSGNVVPLFGQVEQIVDDAKLLIGSSAVIFACGAAKLGLATTFIGKVGDDMFGKFMIDSMNARGIDTSSVIVDPQVHTGLSVILTRQEDRAILTYLGSIPELNFEDVNFDLISQCRHLHLSSYFILDNLRPDIPKLFKKVKEMGLSISLDTNYDPAETWDDGVSEAMKYVDLMLPNETEIMALTGEKDKEKAIEKMALQVPIVAVKLGKNGAIVKSGNKPIIEQEAIPIEVVDTVGAGDSFDAGFIYAFLNQYDQKMALKLAVTCGSLSTRKAGGTDAQANLDEVMQFINTIQ
jgi:sugar/nucleoside kinase (ribokinase family)